jgi:hypothetical protein
MFGTGFALRLAGAEARAAGGWLERAAPCWSTCPDWPALCPWPPQGPNTRIARRLTSEHQP